MEEHLRAQAERIRLAKEAEQGVQRLSFEDDDAALAKAHEEGEHTVKHLGCDLCLAEPARPVPTDDFAEDDEAEVLARNHASGSHDEERIIGCPTCATEAVNDLMGATDGDG